MATALENHAPRTGNLLIDGLLQGGVWQFSGPQVLTYSFSINDTPGMQPAWTPELKAGVVRGLAAWSAVANLTFVESGSGTVYSQSSADLAVTLTGSELQREYGAVGMAMFPTSQSYAWNYPNPSGDIFLDNSYAGYGYLATGGDGLAIILHEIGHALGLKHPHDDGGTGRPTYASYGLTSYDHARHSVMSYNDPWSVSSQRHPGTPMALDILAIQTLYGANHATYAGNDVHVVDPALLATRTLWDAGGTDTLDFSRFGTGLAIDTRPGGVTAIGSSFVGVAYGSYLETIVGTGYADTIVGNRAANTIDGLAGNDALSGEGGADTAVYAGLRHAYTLTQTATGYAIAGPDGVDTLRGIEWARFADQTLRLESAPSRDLGGDGRADLYWRHANGDVAVWEMNGGVPLATPLVAARLAASWRLVDTADFDGDGGADLLWHEAGGAVALWTMDGALPRATPVIAHFADWHPLGGADFDGDGRAELLWRHDDGTLALWHMNGGAPTATPLIGRVDRAWQVAEAADVSGDGKADLLWKHDDGTVALWTMDGHVPVATPIIANFHGAWSLSGAGDFNGDGKADLMWQTPEGKLALWLMAGWAPSATPIVADLGPAWRLIGTGDFGGDGRADLLWRHDGGTLSMWEMDGGRVISSPVVADFGNEWTVS